MKSTMVSMMLLLLSTALVITKGGPQNMMIYNSMELNHPGKSRNCCDTFTFIEKFKYFLLTKFLCVLVNVRCKC